MTRKRSRSESTVRHATEATTYKRRRLYSTRGGSTEEHIGSKRAAIVFWTENLHWPKCSSEQDESPLATEHEQEHRVMNILARKRSSTSLNARSQQASGTLSDSKPSDITGTAYQDARYVALLATKNSYMFESGTGPLDSSKAACQNLLTAEQPIPSSSRFSENVFKLTCQRLQSRNEAKVIQDISRLIVPSVEELVDFGAAHLAPLVESVNESWNNCVSVTKPRPQPDYAVGFRREAFTQGQLDRMQPLVGDLTDQSMFMATYYMYFPFLTCEVKCGAAALDIADRQNAHSMTIALKAIVELFRLVKREQELHRRYLHFLSRTTMKLSRYSGIT
ncbi:hypothetical protein CBER1_11368 [Cercospora berteroae]|uniref:DUF7924 domain-containing protein n=1 Tax=Cercospora berteroae TaxID=357750 RepID=A0A2S6CM08_9PEZI|nr:hypothetical protein CBER1_11368 [Cercospora berteroae]